MTIRREARRYERGGRVSLCRLRLCHSTLTHLATGRLRPASLRVARGKKMWGRGRAPLSPVVSHVPRPFPSVTAVAAGGGRGGRGSNA